MGRKDADVSLEEAYIARFRGRSTACRQALIDIDTRADRAVANAVALEAFLTRYKKEAGTELNARDARFYALFFERLNRIQQAKSWYQALDSLGNEWPLRDFYVRQGMTSPAVERFKLIMNEEFVTIIDGNLNHLKHQRVYETYRLEETIKACVVGKCRERLNVLLAQCIQDAQIKPTARVAQVMGRELTTAEAYDLGIQLIRKRLHEKQTYKYVKRIPSLKLASPYIDALIEDCEGKADLVLGHAVDLGHEMKTEQLERLYEIVQAEIEAHVDAIRPNIWIPVIEELARRSEAWREKLAGAYELATQQALRRLLVAEASHFADKQGLPLRPIELCIQYQHLKDPRWKKFRTSTRPYVRELMLETLQKILSMPPLDEGGKPKPD